MNKTFTAFTPFQMFYHRTIITLMFFFVLTGLPILSSSFHWIAYCFGYPFDFVSGQNSNMLASGIQVCRIIHRVAALLFLIFTVPFVLVQLKNVSNWQIWPESGAEGFKGLKTRYIDFRHSVQGKYNAGQKIAAFIFIVTILLLAISGYILWFRGDFSPETWDKARFIHVLSFVVLIPTLLGHM